jgi:hypothetical protein
MGNDFFIQEVRQEEYLIIVVSRLVKEDKNWNKIGQVLINEHTVPVFQWCDYPLFGFQEADDREGENEPLTKQPQAVFNVIKRFLVLLKEIIDLPARIVLVVHREELHYPDPPRENSLLINGQMLKLSSETYKDFNTRNEKCLALVEFDGSYESLESEWHRYLTVLSAQAGISDKHWELWGFTHTGGFIGKSLEKRFGIYNNLTKCFSKPTYDILSSLLSLHLSLQTFFGISRNENEWGDIFTKKDAFLLVPEAEWDFYASIFNQTMPEEFPHGMCDGYTANCPEETEEYGNERSLAGLLENVADDAKLKETHGAFNRPYGLENNNFVKYLRELCAILANTREDCNKDQSYYGYKGTEEAKRVRNDILSQLEIYPEDNREKHCKLEQDASVNRYYQPLKKQIETWGIEKARRVIEGIEELAELLQE